MRPQPPLRAPPRSRSQRRNLKELRGPLQATPAPRVGGKRGLQGPAAPRRHSEPGQGGTQTPLPSPEPSWGHGSACCGQKGRRGSLSASGPAAPPTAVRTGPRVGEASPSPTAIPTRQGSEATPGQSEDKAQGGLLPLPPLGEPGTYPGTPAEWSGPRPPGPLLAAEIQQGLGLQPALQKTPEPGAVSSLPPVHHPLPEGRGLPLPPLPSLPLFSPPPGASQLSALRPHFDWLEAPLGQGRPLSSLRSGLRAGLAGVPGPAHRGEGEPGRWSDIQGVQMAQAGSDSP